MRLTRVRVAQGRMERALLEERAARQQRQKAWCECLYECFHLRVLTALVPFLVLLTSVFSLLALNERDGWGVGSAFAPLFTLLGLLGLGALSICCSRLCRDVWLCERLRSNHNGCLLSLVHDVLGDRVLPNALLCAALLSSSLFILFFCLRLGGAVDWSFAAVFAPVWLALVLLCALPCVTWSQGGADRAGYALSCWCLGVLPAVAFTALLSARLDGAALSPAEVAVPLLVVAGVLLAGALWMGAVLVRREPRDAFNWCCAVWLACGPPGLSALLVALRGRGDPVSLTQALVPLFFWEALVVIAAFVYSLCVRT